MLNYLFLHIFDYEEINNELNKDKNFNSKLSSTHKSNIRSLDISHDTLKKGKIYKLKQHGNQLKTINYISNQQIERDDNSKLDNEKLPKLKNDIKNSKENEEIKNIVLTNINRKDSVYKKNIISEINLEENFFSKISEKEVENKKNISEIISDINIGNKNHMKKEVKNKNKPQENRKINTSNQNLKIEDSSLNNLNEINEKSSSKQ